jgi:hypothetical protein
VLLAAIFKASSVSILGKEIELDSALVPKAKLPGRIARFTLHFFEMCLPMCIGFAVGDIAYFAVARAFGYSQPFRELPELSVLVVTFNMTAPMAAWMVFRGMPRRVTVEMSAVMPILAAVLLALGWLAIVRKSDLALLEHGLMMPAMLVPMLFRLDVYTRGHKTHTHARLLDRFRTSWS